MADCEKLDTCAFFKEYEQNEDKKLMLGGLARIYCKGSKQDVCIRKKVSKALGGSDKVPVNMMPDGHPITGTSMDDWSDEVKASIKE